MALIKFEDYTGSIVANTVVEALEMIGINHKLNINKYVINVSGIQDKTPNGMIEDTPSKHKITIEKNVFIAKRTKREFNKLKADKMWNDNIFKEQECLNVNLEIAYNMQSIKKIYMDDIGYIWYKHTIEFQIDQLIFETTKGYIERTFELIANYVIKEFS